MIDTHAHLDFPDYNDDFAKVLSEAKESGLSKIVNIGTDLTSSVRSVELADNHDMIYAAVGVHPHDAKSYDDRTETRLCELANDFKVVAIGEIGLDFYRDHSPRDVQREAFVRQITLARRLALPIVVHIRNAYEEALDILASEKATEVGVVLHCFSGNRPEAFRALDLGFMLSFGGVLTFTNSRQPELVKDLPLDRIILETDAPFLTPHPFRGQRNRPALVKLVYQKLAEVRGMQLPDLEKAIDDNAAAFFEFE